MSENDEKTMKDSALSSHQPSSEQDSKQNTGVAAKWRCIPCGYEYDPAVGDAQANIPAGTAFEALPDDWVCPLCGAGKSEFEKIE